MKHVCMLISVADINAARKFYEDLFGLEVFQDYGRNIAFTLSLIHIWNISPRMILTTEWITGMGTASKAVLFVFQSNIRKRGFLW